MRKISPDEVRADFDTQVQSIKDFYDGRQWALFSAQQESTFAELCLLAGAVAWEGFVSDLFVAYINRDSTRFKQHLQDSLDAQLGQQPKAELIFKSFGNLKFPAHLSKAEIENLADRSGNNITFSSYANLVATADKWLVQQHKLRITGVNASRKAAIDALIALRNHVAHRSQRSLDAMNDLLEKGALHNTGMKRGPNRIHNVGSYLKATPPGHQQTRLSIILGEIRAIGAVM